MAQIQFDNHKVAFVLDTGAVNTDLFPPFAAAFPEVMRRAKKDSYKTEGVGSAVVMNVAVLSSLHFRIGGGRLFSPPLMCSSIRRAIRASCFKEILGSIYCTKHIRRPLILGL